MVPGLMSVTLRGAAPAEVIELAQTAGLGLINWTGDAHVPPSDLAGARRIGRATRASGLTIEGYGSYWRADGPFAPWLRAAVTLGAPRIRVWAGTLGSADAGAGARSGVARAIARAADSAAGEGIELALEFHPGTCNDSPAAWRWLAAEVSALRHAGGPVLTYWQPNPGQGAHEALSDLAALAGPLAGCHVFAWDEVSNRFPLWDRRDLWRAVFAGLPESTAALLEFVRGDDHVQLLEDAAVLRRLVQTLHDQ